MKRIIFAAAFAMVLIGSVCAHAVPDFSGTWVLDVNKSDLGIPAAKAQMNKVVLVLKQTATQLSVERSTGNVAVYNLDGSESVNSMPNGGQSKTILNWSGNTLAGKTVSTMNGNDVKMADVRSLSADGREMVLEVSLQMPSGERKQRLVYSKQ